MLHTFMTMLSGLCLGKGTVIFSMTSTPPVLEKLNASMVLGNDILLLVVLEKCETSWDMRERAAKAVVLNVE